jgi:hypothetical protein
MEIVSISEDMVGLRELRLLRYKYLNREVGLPFFVSSLLTVGFVAVTKVTSIFFRMNMHGSQ